MTTLDKKVTDNRRMKALMTAMGTKEPPSSQDVMGIMQRREQKMRTDSVTTQVFCAQCAQEDALEQAEVGPQRLRTRWQMLQMAVQALLGWLHGLQQKVQTRIQGLRRRRVPALLQLSAVECGAA